VKVDYNTRSGVSQPVTFSSTGAKSKAVLDEGGFQQLLAAAYVLQQHNDSLRAKDPRLDATWIFSQISEIENLVRQGELKLPEAAKLASQRLCSITGAVSASVCLLHDGRADCVAESGVGATALGRSITASSVVAEERLKNGRQFQSLDAQADSRLDRAMCRELGVRSLLAVPIQNSDQTNGMIEVRWGLADAIHECDVRTCRLMAGLLAEVLARESSERTESAIQARNSTISHKHLDLPANELNRQIVPNAPNLKEAEPSLDLAEHCRVCGRPFSSDEAFCGHCSMPRVAAAANGDGLQSKWASMWFMQQAKETRHDSQSSTRRPWPTESRSYTPSFAPLAKPSEQPIQAAEAAPVSSLSISTATASPASSFANRIADPEIPAVRVEQTSVEMPDYSTPEHGLRILEDESPADSRTWNWTSLLSHLPPFLSLRIRITRRTVALAVCTVVALLFLVSWLSWPAQSNSHLSMFESLLVDLGLAEVRSLRPAPVYAGNPNARVWEDVHTALYYCPDSDLYGKTPGGRFSTQRSAQQDQFEPATRVACQ